MDFTPDEMNYHSDWKPTVPHSPRLGRKRDV